MIADSIYIRSGRFQTKEFQEPYKPYMNKVIDILERAKETGTFKRGGIVTQVFGMKRYDDLRITQLEEFCSSKEFKQASSRKQFILLNEKIEEIQAQELPEGIGIIRPNQQIEKFLSALQNQDDQVLDEILSEIESKQKSYTKTESESEKTSKPVFNFLGYLSHIVPPEKRLFKKHQALAAAKWWLNTLYKIPEIQAFIKGKIKFKPLELSNTQKRIFITTLADLIWDCCQVPQMNAKEAPPIRVGFNSDFVIQALKAASITSLDTKQGLLIFAFVCQNGEVTYQDGNNDVGSIYNPRIDNALNLPSDQKIVLRDVISTLTTGSSEDNTSLRDLPTELIFHIITYLKPEEMENKELNTELILSCRRINEIFEFFQKESKEKFEIGYLTEKPGLLP